MAPGNRVSADEQPPAYDAEVQTPVHPKPPVVIELEELPPYSAHRPPSSSPPKKSLRRLCWLLPLLLSISIAAIVGGVLASKHHKKAATDQSRDAQFPIITALTATECNAATFVFYQTNTSEIWVQGSLKEGYWNGTGSAQIPALRLDFDAERKWPLYGTNLTAICWPDVNQTIDQAIIQLRVYYLSLSNNILDYSIIEGSFTLPYPASNEVAKYPTSPIPVIQLPLANLSRPTSIAATYLPDFGYIRLYYLTDQSPSLASPAETSTPITTSVTELSWNATSSWSAPNTLNATSLSYTSALAVTAVTASSVTPEIHIVFTNADNELAHIMWVHETWGVASPILDSNSGKPSLDGKDVNRLSLTAPGIHPTELRAYYLDKHIPYELILSPNPTTDPNPNSIPSTYSSSPPTTQPSWLEGIQYPPLIAAVADDALNTTSLFYIWSPVLAQGFFGSLIINETIVRGAIPTGQEQWIAGDSLDIYEGLGG